MRPQAPGPWGLGPLLFCPEFCSAGPRHLLQRPSHVPGRAGSQEPQGHSGDNDRGFRHRGDLPGADLQPAGRPGQPHRYPRHAKVTGKGVLGAGHVGLRGAAWSHAGYKGSCRGPGCRVLSFAQPCPRHWRVKPAEAETGPLGCAVVHSVVASATPMSTGWVHEGEERPGGPGRSAHTRAGVLLRGSGWQEKLERRGGCRLGKPQGPWLQGLSGGTGLEIGTSMARPRSRLCGWGVAPVDVVFWLLLCPR